MCFQVKFIVNSYTRYFSESVGWRLLLFPFHFYAKVHVLVSGLKIANSVLDMFKDILLAFYQLFKGAKADP